MDTPISPGLQAYPTQNGQRYRLYGIVRGTIGDSDAANALAMIGLTGLTYYPQGSQLPSDWPAEPQLPPLSSDERAFRAEGTWTNPNPMPTAVMVGDGGVITYALWQTTPALVPISGQVGSSNANWMLYIGGASLLAGLAVALWPFWQPARNPKGSPEVNHEGLTFSEWLRAAYIGRPLPAPSDPALRALRQAWRNGEDPTEYAVRVNPRTYQTPTSIKCLLNPMSRPFYAVVVGGNMGTVYHGPDQAAAESKYAEYVEWFTAKPDLFRGIEIVLWRGPTPIKIWRDGRESDVSRVRHAPRQKRVTYRGASRFHENPRNYETTVYQFGVPIHVHSVDGGFCADYRAIDRLLEGSGDEVCGRSMNDVIDEAKRRVGVLYVRAQRKHGALPSTPPPPRHNDHLSPWDDAEADTVP